MQLKGMNPVSKEVFQKIPQQSACKSMIGVLFRIIHFNFQIWMKKLDTNMVSYLTDLLFP